MKKKWKPGRSREKIKNKNKSIDVFLVAYVTD